MCGIAGIIGRISDINRASLSRMAAALTHRGPDAEGFWVSSPDAQQRGCMLAHRRLSILDLSSAANQPMLDEAASRALVFNGEIYNFKSIRSRLSAQGEQFHTTGDTEVLLRSLCGDGAKTLPDMRGMFALGFWDDTRRTLLLARDPLGIKPLYIHVNPDPDGDWTVIFASEVRAILASQLMAEHRLNPCAVASCVWNGFVMGPETAVVGIKSLMPGELREFDQDGRQLRSETYWSMPPRAGDGEPASRESFKLALQESVQLHLISDVPTGVFLSGGVDSSVVANVAQRSLRTSLDTFTLAFQEEHYNEAAYAREVAKAIGTRHHEIVLSQSRFESQLEEAIDSLDQPTFDGLNSYFMSRAVREAGLVVALVGTGGDELFGGYGTFQALPRMQWLRRHAGWIPEQARAMAAHAASAVMSGFAGRFANHARWAKLPAMLEAANDPIRLYQLAYALFLPSFQAMLLDGSISSDCLENGLTPEMHRRLEAEIAGCSPLSTVSILEQRCFLGERLLRDSDAASMAVAMEMRLPLVDTVLFECVNRLPDDLRYHPVGRKSLLREVGLEGLDPSLFDRPKSGFVLPFGDWTRSRLGKTMHDTMMDASLLRRIGLCPDTVAGLWNAYQASSSRVYWSRVWAIYALARWCQKYDVFLQTPVRESVTV